MGGRASPAWGSQMMRPASASAGQNTRGVADEKNISWVVRREGGQGVGTLGVANGGQHV